MSNILVHDRKQHPPTKTTHFKRSRVSKKGIWRYCFLLIGFSLLNACETLPKASLPSKQNTILAYQPSEYTQAYEYFSQKAAQGEPIAMRNLGEMYLSGRGISADPNNARYWLNKAAEKSDPAAMVDLGILSIYGEGFPKSTQLGCQYFEKAKKAHNIDATAFYQQYCVKSF